jgi:ribokinase
VPAVPVEALDPTGAGDAFCGAFAVSFGRRGDLLDAACRATVAASFVVERRGALAVLPLDRASAERRLARLRVQLNR